MGNRTYLCTVSSNSTDDRTYVINHRSAMKAAQEYGRAEGNESVTIRTHTGKTLSKVVWDPQSRKYINVNFN